MHDSQLANESKLAGWLSNGIKLEIPLWPSRWLAGTVSCWNHFSKSNGSSLALEINSTFPSVKIYQENITLEGKGAGKGKWKREREARFLCSPAPNHAVTPPAVRPSRPPAKRQAAPAPFGGSGRQVGTAQPPRPPAPSYLWGGRRSEPRGGTGRPGGRGAAVPPSPRRTGASSRRCRCPPAVGQSPGRAVGWRSPGAPAPTPGAGQQRGGGQQDRRRCPAGESHPTAAPGEGTVGEGKAAVSACPSAPHPLFPSPPSPARIPSYTFLSP